MFSLKNITKIYQRGAEKVFALDHLSLDIAQGEYAGIVGPSGSGKSTLMNILGLLDIPTSGSVYIGGQKIEDMGTPRQTQLRRKTIGFVFQQFLLVPTMTALQNVMLPLYFVGSPDAKTRAMALLTKVGLEKRRDHLPSQLSGGEMQRVAIARALANEPSVLLADEPAGNLDSKTASDIYALFGEINREGTTIIMVTHNHELAETFPRMISIRDGRLERDQKK
ncbi:MAG: ABC transporter ATP-binding protein [Syntrophaceae bacterium]|nr:MAG: ABC transporter ATP-binding protein [Syntrophaceae bacterium]